MFEISREIYYVAWSDIRFMRHNILNVALISLMGPLLYVIAFGFGLGSSAVVAGVPYIAFMIPGIIALTTLNSSFGSTATRINVQRLYYRSFDEMLMCPLHYYSIVLGKSIMGVVRGLISSAIIFVIGLFLTSELMLTPMFVITVILSCFTYACLGETAAILAKSHQSMTLFNTLVILPMTFLCGTFFSTASVPEAFRWILYLIPLTHTSEAVRASALGWNYPWISFIILIAYAVVFFIINVYLIKTRRV